MATRNVVPPLRTVLRLLLALGMLAAMWPPRPAAASPNDAAPPDAARVVSLITAITGEPPFQTTLIYDRRGELLAEFDRLGRRTVVGLDEIPDFLIKATIATEDRRFFEHTGVDYFAIARATLQNAQSDRIVSGGSTITQQLARLLFLPPAERYEQTLSRKLKEADKAFYLEANYSKEEILAMYLNMVYYGNQAYGVAAAARVYFNKSLDELTPAESAVLAGLPQSPVDYDPLTNPEKAKERQRIVLSLMVEAGYLTPTEAKSIAAQPILYQHYRKPKPRAPHFVDYVRALLEERYGTEALDWGLQVHTSLDLRYQAIAEEVARAQVKTAGKRYRFSNAAVIMLHPVTGEILAMVGSIDFDDPKINGQVNMTTSPRQPGSSIKPVVYAAAFERGWSPASVIWDLPVSYRLSGTRRYRPMNITRRFYGPVRLRMALSNSLNVPAVKLLNEIGVPAMLDTARKLGIDSWRKPTSTYGLSLAVGGYEVTLLELTHAFATLANQGVYTPLQPILLLKDGAGRVLYRPDPAAGRRQAVSPVTAYQIASILSDARARRLMFPRPSPLDTSRVTAVKTGTTDGWRDNLTVGFTPYLTVGVWTGNSNGRPMRRAVGVYTAGPIWHDIMEAVWANPALYDTLGYANEPLPEGFTPPTEIEIVPVCDWLPGRFNPNCRRMVPEVFAKDAGPSLTGRPRGYCLLASAPNAPTEAYFLSLPRDRQGATLARRWVRSRYDLAVDNVRRCDTTPRRRPLVKQPKLLPPRKLVKSANIDSVLASPSTWFARPQE
jgi:1A family penicillin-binding protein